MEVQNLCLIYQKENLMNIEIILPPIELQNQFADIVKQIDKQKFEIENSLKRNAGIIRKFDGKILLNRKML